MPLTEHRSWTASCGRRVTADCVEESTVVADEKIVRSTAAAEKLLRLEGWRLGKVNTCPSCWAAWSGA